jgi:hypothetical protein
MLGAQWVLLVARAVRACATACEPPTRPGRGFGADATRYYYPRRREDNSSLGVNIVLRRAYLLFMGLLLMGAPALAEMNEEERQSEDLTGWAIRTGIGFTASPETFLMNFEGEYRYVSNIAVGVAMQIGVKNNLTIVSPAVYARYVFSLDDANSESVRRLEPYLQSGLGLSYRNRDSGGDDIGFLLNFGGGLDYRLSDSVSLGTRMLFNFLPVNVFGDSFYYTWEMASFRYRF